MTTNTTWPSHTLTPWFPACAWQGRLCHHTRLGRRRNLFTASESSRNLDDRRSVLVSILACFWQAARYDRQRTSYRLSCASISACVGTIDCLLLSSSPKWRNEIRNQSNLALLVCKFRAVARLPRVVNAMSGNLHLVGISLSNP